MLWFGHRSFKVFAFTHTRLHSSFRGLGKILSVFEALLCHWAAEYVLEPDAVLDCWTSYSDCVVKDTF